MIITWKSISRILSVFIMLFLVQHLAAGERREINKAFDVKPGGELILETDMGSVEIGSGTDNQVKVEVILEARTRDTERAERFFEDFQVQFDQQGDDVEIYADYDGRRARKGFRDSDYDHLKVEFLITVPSEYDISVDTKGGSIYVRDLKGRVKVKTAGGSLAFEEINGDIDGFTAGGSIELAACSGEVDVKTSGGSISIGKVKGNVEAHTSGGSIKVAEAGGNLNASTSGGSVQAHLANQPTNDCRLTTSGGSVTVHVDKSVAVDLDAETSSGKVDIEFPISLVGRVSDNSIRGSMNGGGPVLYLRTSGGNIYIKEL